MSYAAAEEVAAPMDAVIASFYPNADFRDAYAIPIGNDSRTALALYLDIVSQTPAWVEGLMTVRNRAVAIFGIKDLGALSSFETDKSVDDYKLGDRVGIFRLHHLSDDEVILADADRHLDAKVSVRRLRSNDTMSLQVTTVVHIHNLLGRAYMSLVVPAHRRIVPAILARYTKRK
jgi:hypothetical protein